MDSGLAREERAPRNDGGVVRERCFVIAGLDPAIHLREKMDTRIKSGHDASQVTHRFRPDSGYTHCKAQRSAGFQSRRH